MDGKVELYFVNRDGDTECVSVPCWSTSAALSHYTHRGYRHVTYYQFLKAVAKGNKAAEAAEGLLLGGR